MRVNLAARPEAAPSVVLKPRLLSPDFDTTLSAMFTRMHTVNGSTYYEVLESYRDPVTRRPKHRLVVRWRYGQGVENVQEALPAARQSRRRARDDLAEAERRLGGWRDQLNYSDATAEAQQTAAAQLARAAPRLAALRRREARAAKLIAGLVKAQAGLARSGKAAPRRRIITTTATSARAAASEFVTEPELDALE